MDTVTPDLRDYRPGRGYTITRYLGSGAWKSAFRGRAQGASEDIALLCYHSGSRTAAADDLKPMFRIEPTHEFAEYLPVFYFVFPGEDHRIWIAEELIPQSLSRLWPISDVSIFTRFARDLSRGLRCIHDHGLVHRDIKLDNCGAYKRLEKAKIFDLGSLVSEPGAVACTVLTRPPELLCEDTGEGYSSRGDVWALGATLFALRTGDYPFVPRSEVAQRSALNRQLAFAKMEDEREDARRSKATLDEAISTRAIEDKAEEKLRRRVRANFGGRVGDLLLKMLAFDAARRPTSEEIEKDWTTLARDLSRPVLSPAPMGHWDGAKSILEVILKGGITVTASQLGRLESEWAEAKEENSAISEAVPEFDSLLKRVRRSVDSARGAN